MQLLVLRPALFYEHLLLPPVRDNVWSATNSPKHKVVYCLVCWWCSHPHSSPAQCPPNADHVHSRPQIGCTEYGFRLSPNPYSGVQVQQRPQSASMGNRYTGDTIGILEASMNSGEFVMRQLGGIQNQYSNPQSLCLLPLNGPSTPSNSMIPPSISSPAAQTEYRPVLKVLNASPGDKCQSAVSNVQKNQPMTMPKLADLDQKPKLKSITSSTMKRGRHISSAEKPFVCTTCGKGYKYLCNYRSHCKIHSLVVC